MHLLARRESCKSGKEHSLGTELHCQSVDQIGSTKVPAISSKGKQAKCKYQSVSVGKNGVNRLKYEVPKGMSIGKVSPVCSRLPKKDQRDRDGPKHWTLNLHPKNRPSPAFYVKESCSQNIKAEEREKRQHNLHKYPAIWSSISVLLLHPTRAKFLLVGPLTMMAETRCFDHCDHSTSWDCQIHETTRDKHVTGKSWRY